MATGLSSFQYDANGDVISHDIHLNAEGDLAVVNGLEELRQRIACRLQMFRGENIYNVNQGIPLRNEILGVGLNPSVATSIITSEILSIPEVTSVQDIDLTLEDRHLTYVAATVESVFGTITLEVG